MEPAPEAPLTTSECNFLESPCFNKVTATGNYRHPQICWFQEALHVAVSAAPTAVLGRYRYMCSCNVLVLLYWQWQALLQ